MRNLKRVLSMALASMMVLGLTVVGANAANFNDQAEITHTTAADVMTAIGVLEGNEKGEFLPNEVLTREQAAKIVCYMLMGPENAEKLGVSGTQFTDVAADRWSAPYISYCANMGILVGDGTGKFLPEAQLTGHAFAKMMLTALGYDATIQNYTGAAWTISVATDAVNAGIFVDGTVMSDPMTRDQAAQMAFQTLEANTVTYSNKGTTITVGGVEIVQGASAPTEGDAFMTKYFKDLEKTEDGEDSLGRPAVVWTYNDEDVCKATETADKTLVVDADAADKSTYADAVDELLDKDVTATLKAVNGKTSAPTDDPKAGDVLYLYETAKDTYDVYVAQYSFAIVDKVDTDVSSADEDDGVSAYVTLTELNGDEVLSDVNDTDFAGFAYEEGDAIAYIANDSDEVIASYALETVEGSVTAYKANDYVRVDGTRYEMSGNMDANSVKSNYDFDATYVLYVDANGYVIAIDGVTAAATLDDVYYVVATYTEETVSYGVSTYNTYAQAIALDGTVEEVLIEKDSTPGYQGSVVAGLYTFAENDDDSDVSDATAYTSDDYDVLNVKKTDGKVSVTASTSRLNGDPSGRAYLNSRTEYIVVEGSLGDLDVRTYTGSARVTVDSAIAITDSSNNAVYVILVANTATGTVAEEDALIYVASTGATVSGGVEATAYDMSGKELDIILESAKDAGLYTYAIDEDGVYTDLTAVAKTAISDDEGYAVDATLEGVYSDTLLTFKVTNSGSTGSDSATFEDWDAANATIIDLRDEFDAPYDREINTLNRLISAIDAGDVTATLYVNDSVQVIFVTNVAE